MSYLYYFALDPHTKRFEPSARNSRGLLLCCIFVGGFKFFSDHFFNCESLGSLCFRSTAQPLTLPSRWYATTCAYNPGALSLILSLSCLWQGVRCVSLYSACSLVLCILSQTVYLATPFLVACLRRVLHVSLCCGALCVMCSVVRAIEHLVLSAQIALT